MPLTGALFPELVEEPWLFVLCRRTAFNRNDIRHRHHIQTVPVRGTVTEEQLRQWVVTVHPAVYKVLLRARLDAQQRAIGEEIRHLLVVFGCLAPSCGFSFGFSGGRWLRRNISSEGGCVVGCAGNSVAPGASTHMCAGRRLLLLGRSIAGTARER